MQTLNDEESLNSVLSPILRIPPELLSEIFLKCLNDKRRHISHNNPARLPTRFPRPSSCEAPLLLLWVCATWRRVAFETPSLWTSIELHTSFIQKKGSAHALRQWISRSGSLPISFEFCRASPRVQKEAPNIIKILTSNAYRWKYVGFSTAQDFYEFPFLTEILDSLSSTTSILEHVEIGSGLARNARFDLTHAYNIEKLCISSRNAIPSFKLGHTKFERLRMLELESCIHVDDLWMLMKHTGSLEYLQLSIQTWESPIHLKDMITLSKLKVFSCEFGPRDRPDFDPGPILDWMAFPALQELTIDFIHQPSRTNWPHLANFLGRSRPPLHSLAIFGTPMKQHELISCLHLAPNIRRLSLSFHMSADPAFIFPALTPLSLDKECVHCCRYLEVLYISHCGPFSQRELLNMVHARLDDSLYIVDPTVSKFSSGSGRLRHISVVHETSLDPDFTKELNDYNSEGFDFGWEKTLSLAELLNEDNGL